MFRWRASTAAILFLMFDIETVLLYPWAVTDFENEIQLAQTNHALMPGIETMFLATSIKWSYLSSTIVKEAAYYGSDIGKFVTPNVEKAVNEKYALIRQKKDPET